MILIPCEQFLRFQTQIPLCRYLLVFQLFSWSIFMSVLVISLDLFLDIFSHIFFNFCCQHNILLVLITFFHWSIFQVFLPASYAEFLRTWPSLWIPFYCHWNDFVDFISISVGFSWKLIFLAADIIKHSSWKFITLSWI